MHEFEYGAPTEPIHAVSHSAPTEPLDNFTCYAPTRPIGTLSYDAQVTDSDNMQFIDLHPREEAHSWDVISPRASTRRLLKRTWPFLATLGAIAILSGVMLSFFGFPSIPVEVQNSMQSTLSTTAKSASSQSATPSSGQIQVSGKPVPQFSAGSPPSPPTHMKPQPPSGLPASHGHRNHALGPPQPVFPGQP
jgi:hypothetical protein